MADFLKITLEEFVQKYTRSVGGHRSLREHPKTYDCVFLNGKRCNVYGARPKQCRTFPWWSENVATPKDWEETAQRCEGVNHPDAPLISLQEIQKHLPPSKE
jgi:Fe-S-cluster containining protein